MPTKRPPRAPCRPDDPPSLHERLIRDLLASDERICRNGFWRAVAALATELDEEITATRQHFGFLPDAYVLDRQECEIVIYEVEVRGTLSPDKLTLLGRFWDWWDASGEHDWLPRLILVNRFGHQNEIELREYAYA